VTWRDSVWAIRRGWSAQGGSTTYKVWLQQPESQARLAFTAEPATAEPVLDGKNLSVAPVEGGFQVVVSRNNATLARADMPSAGGNVTVAGITFEREGRHVYAVLNETRVKVFTKEQYGRNRVLSDAGYGDQSIRYASASTTARSASWNSNWLSTSSSTAKASVTSPPASAT